MSGSITLNNTKVGLTLNDVEVDEVVIDLDDFFGELEASEIAEYVDLDDLLPHYDADDILKELNIRELTNYDTLAEKLNDEMDVSEAWDFCKTLMEYYATKGQTALDVIRASLIEENC